MSLLVVGWKSFVSIYNFSENCWEELNLKTQNFLQGFLRIISCEQDRRNTTWRRKNLVADRPGDERFFTLGSPGVLPTSPKATEIRPPSPGGAAVTLTLHSAIKLGALPAQHALSFPQLHRQLDTPPASLSIFFPLVVVTLQT